MVASKGNAKDREPVPDLPTLIHTVKGDQSFDDLVARSGGRLTRQNIHNMTAREFKAFPDPATLKVLAETLEVPVTTVVLAAARSVGLEVSRSVPRLAMLAPPAADRITDRQLDAVLAVIKSMLDPVATEPGPSVRVQAHERRRGERRRRGAG